MPKLGEAEISVRLRAIPGWTCTNDTISKQYRFKDFMAAIGFVNLIAQMAEAADHHPDILINYSRVTFSCSTHDEGGVTTAVPTKRLSQGSGFFTRLDHFDSGEPLVRYGVAD